MTPLRRASPLRITALAVAAALGGLTLPVVAASASAPAVPALARADAQCPRFPATRPPSLPPPSPMPTHEAGFPAIGGPAMATTGLAVPPGAPALPGDVSATSWLVADLDTGAVLGACAPHAAGAPASLQKLLLAETVLPRLNAADSVTITKEDLDFEPGSSAVGLILGGTYPIETIWLGLFLNSGNDAANVLARLGGGDRGIKGTLTDMNAEARRLGAFETHAETPSGLDGPGQATSAYDLALITRACFARADFRQYVSTRTAMIPPQGTKKGYQIQNDNKLLFNYPGALGGKTGFTDIARHTYVGLAERDGRRLVVTVLGAEIQPVRSWQQGASLLDWAFSLPRDASVGRLVAPGEGEAQLAAAHPAPTPDAAPAAVAAVVAHASNPGLIASIGAAVVAFVGIWIAVLVVGRRRRRRTRMAVAPPASNVVPVEATDYITPAAPPSSPLSPPPPSSPPLSPPSPPPSSAI